MQWYCDAHRISKHYADKRRPKPVSATQDAMKAAAKTAVTEVVPFRSLDEHVHAVMKRWGALDRSVQKFTDARLSLALELLALKRRIENGEVGDLAAVDWWGWFAENCRRSRSEAEKMLAIAASSDPPAAIAHQRALTPKRVAAHKARQQSGAAAPQGDVALLTQPTVSLERSLMDAKPSTVEPTLSEAEERDLQLIFDAFDRLSWHGRREAVKGISRMYREWH
jgi:hypothetical protein